MFSLQLFDDCHSHTISRRTVSTIVMHCMEHYRE